MDLEKRPQSPEPTARTEPATPPSGLRASDADRDRVADILRNALAEGRLTAEEHAERVDGVYRAKTVGELEPLVHDLPADEPASRAYQRRHPSVPTSAAPADPAAGAAPSTADDNLVAVFSSSTRRGRWRVGRKTHAYAIFGSVEIDLSEALFAYRQVVIKAVSIFGNVEISVPENISLRGSGGGVMGNFEVDTLESPDPDAPVVIVEGVAIFGNIEARPRRGRLIRDIEHRIRKHLGR